MRSASAARAAEAPSRVRLRHVAVGACGRQESDALQRIPHFPQSPRLFRSDLLVAGDAAGFCANTGIVLMGMNLAIASGKCADDTAIHACQQGDFSAATLAHYRTLLDHQYGHAETALE